MPATVVGTGTTFSTANSTSRTFGAASWPADKQPGDLLLVFMTFDGTPVVNSVSAGTTLLATNAGTTGSTGWHVLGRIATAAGTGGDAMTAVISASEAFAAYGVVIRGYDPAVALTPGQLETYSASRSLGSWEDPIASPTVPGANANDVSIVGMATENPAWTNSAISWNGGATTYVGGTSTLHAGLRATAVSGRATPADWANTQVSAMAIGAAHYVVKGAPENSVSGVTEAYSATSGSVSASQAVATLAPQSYFTGFETANPFVDYAPFTGGYARTMSLTAHSGGYVLDAMTSPNGAAIATLPQSFAGPTIFEAWIRPVTGLMYDHTVSVILYDTAGGNPLMGSGIAAIGYTAATAQHRFFLNSSANGVDVSIPMDAWYRVVLTWSGSTFNASLYNAAGSQIATIGPLPPGGSINGPVSPALYSGNSGGVGTFAWYDSMSIQNVAPPGVVSTTSGFVTKLSSTSGTTAILSTNSGAVTKRAPASGVTSVVSATPGSPAVRAQVSGRVDAVSTSSGNATARQGASGSTAVVSTTSGASSKLTRTSGTTAVVSTTSGDVLKVSLISGRTDAVSATAGSITQTHAISGTTSVVSTTAGAATVRGQASGRVDVISATSGSVTPASSLSGTVSVASSTSGSVTRRMPLAGTAEVVSATSGEVAKSSPVAGVSEVESTTSGTVGRTSLVEGSTDVVSETSGSVEVGAGLSGRTTVTSGTSGEVTAVYSLWGEGQFGFGEGGFGEENFGGVGGTQVVSSTWGDATVSLIGVVDVVSSTTGSVTKTSQVSGAVSVTSGTSGAATKSSGAQGVVAVASKTTGATSLLASIAGATHVVSKTSAASLRLFAQVSGTTAVISATSGELSEFILLPPVPDKLMLTGVTVRKSLSGIVVRHALSGVLVNRDLSGRAVDARLEGRVVQHTLVE